MLLIVLGSCIYAFGLVTFNIANDLAEGGIMGITLILRALPHFSPVYTTLLVNIPLLLTGGRTLGKRSLYYTLVGTVSLLVLLRFWQKFSVEINLDHDLLIAALLAGLAARSGSGPVHCVGRTAGGTDVIVRIFEKYFRTNMGRSLLLSDVTVLLLSLAYIDVKQTVYILTVSFVFSRAADSVLDEAYAAKRILIVSNHSEEVD